MNRRSRLRKPVLGAVILLIASLAYGVWSGVRHYRIESRINGALSLSDQSGNLTVAGTNTLLTIGEDAVPVVLRWSAGKEAAWYSLSQRVLRKFGLNIPIANMWERKEKARKVAHILRSEAKAAVPTLRKRLTDSNPEVRRFSVHILGAIGPSIGADAFQQMTNCLQDADNNVRNDVVWALQFHNVHAYPVEILIPVFLAGIQDPFKVTRENAHAGLKRLMERDKTAQKEVEKAVLESGLILRSIVRPWEHESRTVDKHQVN